MIFTVSLGDRIEYNSFVLVIPAVDIQNGRAVRLFEGDPERETVYFEDPVEAAVYWELQGAQMLHLVDLDAATGRGENRKIIRRIAESTTVPFQVGGGVRSLEAAREVLALGAARVVVGTIAVKAPEVLSAMLEEFGQKKVVVSLDAKGTEVVVSGWQEGTHLDARDLSKELWSRGVRTLIYTDVRRDGTLQGLDLESVNQIRQAWPGYLIAGGGIASDRDIEGLEKLKVEGAITGKALYEGRIELGRWV